MLSDWTHENPDDIMRTLLRGSDWYAIRKGTAQSLLGAIRSGHLRDYVRREKSLLPPMDVSDIAYDAFLINGRPRSHLPAPPGETLAPGISTDRSSAIQRCGSSLPTRGDIRHNPPRFRLA